MQNNGSARRGDTTLSKYISVAIDALLFTMGPGKFIKTTHSHAIEYDVMERYFTKVVLPVIENIFDLINYDFAHEMDNLYHDIFHHFDLLKLNAQSCRVNRICKKLKRQLTKTEDLYVCEVGNVHSFYKLRNECYIEVCAKMNNESSMNYSNLKFNNIINEQLIGRSVADIKRDIELSKIKRDVYSQYVLIRQIYNIATCESVQSGQEDLIRCYEDYNGCVENMKPAILSQFIRPGYRCIASTNPKFVQIELSESTVESIVHDFNNALTRLAPV